MTTLEEIIVRLGLDATRLEEGYRKTGEGMKDWAKDTAKEILGIFGGIFAVEKFAESIKDVADWGKQIKLTAEEAGVTTDFIQGLESAAHKLGISSESAGNSLAILARKVGEAREAGQGSEAHKLFDKWGIDIEGKSQEEVFYSIANSLKQIQDPAMRDAMAFDLMGKGAKEMAVGMSAGADALRGMIDVSSKLSEGEIERLHQIDSKLEELGRKWHVLWGGIVSSVMDSPAGRLSDSDIDKRARELQGKANIFMRGASSGPFRNQAIDELNKELDDQIKKHKEIEGSKVNQSSLDKKDLELVERAAKIRSENQLNELTNADKLNSLLKKKAEYESVNWKIKLTGQQVLDEAENEREILRLKKEIGKESEEQDKKAGEELQKRVKANKELHDKEIEQTERLKYLRQEQLEDQNSPSYWTVNELANSGQWRGQAGVYARTAQRIELLERDAKMANIYGNTDRRDADLQEARMRTGWLEKSGVIRPDHRLESIDESIKRQLDLMTSSGIAIKDD